MKTLAPLRTLARHAEVYEVHHAHGGLGWFAAIGTVSAAAWLTRSLPGWSMMCSVALTEWLVLKIATLRGIPGSPWRRTAYFIWPGMNAGKFLSPRRERPHSPGELVLALANLAIGLALCRWAILHIAAMDSLLDAWVGMLGLIFALHFGLFHVLSWGWRAAGVDAPPIMNAPIAATSLAEFWSARWNLAFADSARRFVLRPLARRGGARPAGFTVFLLSGVVHETVISLPARGGWGGPTLYFLLHALGLALEKSALGRRCGLGHGVRGWIWTMLFAAAPLPLLFHPPFVRNVIAPFYRALAALLS
jgi:hypothetical protein